MTDFVRLLKWIGITSGTVTFLNIVGVSVFLLIKGEWNELIFLRSLLEYIMLEGLVMALIGSLSFFGFEKYRTLLRGETTSGRHQKNENKPKTEEKLRLNIGELLLSAGFLLFVIALACLFLIF